MDLTLAEEQQLLVDSARRFLSDRCPPGEVRRLEGDARGFDPATWREMARLGWLGIEMPEALGGGGQGFVETVLLAEEMGRALLPSPFLASVAMATPLLEAVGGAAERERWLPGLCEGTFVASVGLAEPDWRDPYAVPTLRARFVGAPDTSEDEVVLDGTKCFVPFAPDADVLIVSVDGGRLARVERGAAGLRYRRQTTLGGDPVYAVQLDGTPAVLLGNGKANCAAALRAALDRGAVASFAYALGAAERALELSVDHAKTREQFGRPIGSFQAVAHRCVDMRSDLDALRYLVYQAAWNLAQHASAPLEVAAARAFGIEALRNMERHAHQVHGAIGFSTEHDLHLYTRRAKATELMWGSISRAREEVASAMGL